MGVALSEVTDDALWFADQALDQMIAILVELGDAGANRRPDLEGANSAYAVATHCLGVMEFWGGFMIAGRDVQRDRAAEFVASGSAADLVVRLVAAKAQLASDVSDLDPSGGVPEIGESEDVPYRERQGAVLLHVLEELYQHLGQMELGRDVVRAGGELAECDIACTLGAQAWVERIGEWQEFARTFVVERECSVGRLRLGLLGGDDALAAAVSLARREKECCAFFEFRLDIAAGGTALVISAPSPAEPVLASFADMLGRAGS